MVRRIAPVGVVSFVLLAVCGVACQKVREPLPESPSVEAASQTQRFSAFSEPARSPLNFDAIGAQPGVMRQAGFTSYASLVFRQNNSSTVESKNIFSKYLYPSSLKQQSGYHFSSSESLMGRATYATSR